MQDIIILGSIGSIDTRALEIVTTHLGHFRIQALTVSGTHLDLLAHQAVEHRVPLVMVANSSAGELDQALEAAQAQSDKPPVRHRLLTGRVGVEAAAGCVPGGIVLNDIAGISGSHATLHALDSGMQLTLASKESLVIDGSLVREAVVRPGQITPVGSEHSATWRALRPEEHEWRLYTSQVTGYTEASRLILTASDGPLRDKARTELEHVTVVEALRYSTWDVGPLMTINSTTMFNRGLEVIEASLLFDIDPKFTDVVVHPASVMYSMVEFRDRVILLQTSPPDMRIPIILGPSVPSRLRNVVLSCDWTRPVNRHFKSVDNQALPAVNLARQALQTSATRPAVLASVDEVAVTALLDGQLPFLGIYDVVSWAITEYHGKDTPELAELEATSQWARRRATELIAEQH